MFFYLRIPHSFIKCGSSLTFWNTLQQNQRAGRGESGGGSLSVNE